MNGLLVTILNVAGQICAGTALLVGAAGLAYWILKPTDPVAEVERAIEEARTWRVPTQPDWKDRLIISGLSWAVAWYDQNLGRDMARLIAMDDGPERDALLRQAALHEALLRQTLRALAQTRDAIDARAEYLADRYAMPIVLDMRRQF